MVEEEEEKRGKELASCNDQQNMGKTKADAFYALYTQLLTLHKR
jgi:hypothetical protein